MIGETPLIKLEGISEDLGINVYAKTEFVNPGGSVKDRVALKMVLDARASGKLAPGGTVYEGTSGSTGISLAMVCKALGHPCVIFLPDDVAPEKINTLRAVGAEVRLCKSVSVVDEAHMCRAAERAAKEDDPEGKGLAFFTDQFENPSNFLAHVTGTGPEIARQIVQDHNQSGVDFFVSGSGTGGTIAGCAVALRKAFGARTKVLLADPPGSALAGSVNSGVLFTEADKEGHRRRVVDDTVIEGVGLNRLTRNHRAAVPLISRAYRVEDIEAVRMSRWLVRREGLFCGSSSAMNLVAITRAVKEGVIPPGSNVVTILCDSGMRHLSKFYSQAYLDGRKGRRGMPQGELGVAAKQELQSVFECLEQ